MACEKMQALAEPAYIKDSELRVVCANRAFAQLLGFEPENIAGIKPENLAVDFDFTDWVERERHTFIFGEDQSAAFTSWNADIRYTIEIERFITEEDEIFIFGQFFDTAQRIVTEQADSLAQVAEIGRWPEAMPERPDESADINDEVSAEHLLADGAIADLLLEAITGLDAGILVYNSAGYLRYANPKFYEMDPIFRGVVEVGMQIGEIIAGVHDVLVRQDPDLSEAERETARAQWIAGRLASHQQPYHEIISDMGDGRWVRVLNRCLNSGVVISLRIDITQQKALELDLQKQMNEVKIYQAVLEDLPVAAYVRDQDLKLLFGNAAYVDLIGKPLLDILGQTPNEMHGPHNRRPAALNNSALENDGLQAAEFEYQRENGEIIATYARSQRITTDDGNSYVIGSITDVTEIRQRERELIQAENQARQFREDLEDIVDLIPLGLLVLDRDMKIELVNATFCNFVQIHSKQDLLGMHLVDYLRYAVERLLPDLSAEAAELAIQRWYESAKTGTQGGVELAFGPDHIFTCVATPFGDGRVVVTYTDITEAKKRELEILKTRRELEQTGAILREASSVMEQGLIVIEDNNIIYVNKAYRDILDLPTDSILADQTFDSALRTLISRGEFEAESQVPNIEYQHFMEAFQQRQYYDAVVYLEKLRRWVNVEIVPAGDNRVVVVFNNVTELKQREHELEKMLRRAEAADRVKSEFLANMSHEIRTPMNGVLAMTGLLASTQMDTRQKTFLDGAIKSGKTLLTIINDVLDFSKMDGGQLELKHVVFSPSEAVEDVAMLMASRVSERNLDFMIEIDPGVPSLVRSDAGRFRQIVTNLVSNAIKFTDNGHVSINLAAEMLENNICELVISVEDTGSGIPDEKLATIEQALGSDGKGGDLYPKGAGLGLPITIGLIRLFSGKLEFQTDPAKGTKAIVRLPMALESNRRRALPVPTGFSGSRLLVIDDYQPSCEHITQMAEAFGFEVAGARSGDEGLAILSLALSAGLPVDVVLLDTAMDWMGGIEIARAIRSNPLFTSVEIILIADVDRIADDGVLNSLNIGAVVTKPVRRSLLQESLFNVLDARKSGKTSVHSNSMDISSAAVHTSDRLTPTESAPQPVPSTLPKVTVLVAEDNEINKIVFSQILTALDISHYIVSNGQEAIDAWKNLSPMVILMDVDMPILDGFSASRHIRALQKGSDKTVSIIGVTPNADEQMFQECLNAGMDDHLSKPLSPERLGSMISKWCKSAQDRQAASR